MPVRIPWGAPLTVADVADYPDDGHRYELIDGTLVVTPGPGWPHQAVVGELYVLLREGVTDDLRVCLAPFDWIAGPHTVLQPDLMAVRRSDITPENLQGPPLLAVEVLSPSTRAVDLGLKRLAFADAGVPAYWVVDPVEPSLRVFAHDGTDLVEVAYVRGDEAYDATRPVAARVVPNQLTDR